MVTVLSVIIALMVIGFFGWTYYHQRLLKTRAYLMREALRNKDFSFRLPTNGLLSGERDIQCLLNDLGRDIQRLVDQHEVESWQRLTRVLTHEIMNDVSPIASICQSLMKREEFKGTSAGMGIKAISDTSSHLINFVDSYRKFAQLQEPQKVNFNPLKLVEKVRDLYSNVSFDIRIPDNAVINADENLMRHVINNIIKNAVEAQANKIAISYEHSSNTSTLLISNNGQPINTINAAEIFTPFFTTKTTGSGIGLSLSRQIIVMQGGRLTLRNVALPDYGVTFEINM